jgi:hypothetical protein
MTDDFDENFDDVMNDFDGDDNAAIEEQTMKDNAETDDPVMAGKDTIKFDFSKASKKTKRPERVNLNNETVVIEDAELEIPGLNTEWKYTQKSKVPYKDCIFKVVYDRDGQYEYYSGVKVFRREDKTTGKEGYSEPSIDNNGKTQATMLKKAYAEFKGKRMEEVSNYEFLNYLKSKPKAVLEWKGFEWDNKTTYKNMVKKFV